MFWRDGAAAALSTVLRGDLEAPLAHHEIKAPTDITKTRYSTPFRVALALYRDPDGPAVVRYARG